MKTTIDDIGLIDKGAGISKSDLSETGEPCILYGELYTKYKSEIIKEVVSKTNTPSDKLVRSNANDVIIPCSGETSIDIATARCVPYDNILLGGDLNVLRLNEGIDGAFLSYQLNGKRKTDIAKVAQGVSVVHLYPEHIKGIKVYLPQSEEQHKIAHLLSLLDERIIAQNKIIDNLQSLIKGLVVSHYNLSSLGNSIKISELGEPFSVMNLSKEQLSSKGQPCIIYGELFTHYGAVIDEIVSRTQVSEGITLSTGRDLLFPSSTTVDAISLIAPSALNQKGVILGGDMFCIKVDEKFSVSYLSYFFNYICASELAKYAKGSTIIHLHYKEIANHKIKLPTLEAQKKCVCMATNLQCKIDIEIKMLRELQHLKSYLLDAMFI